MYLLGISSEKGSVQIMVNLERSCPHLLKSDTDLHWIWPLLLWRHMVLDYHWIFEFQRCNLGWKFGNGCCQQEQKCYSNHRVSFLLLSLLQLYNCLHQKQSVPWIYHQLWKYSGWCLQREIQICLGLYQSRRWSSQHDSSAEWPSQCHCNCVPVTEGGWWRYTSLQTVLHLWNWHSVVKSGGWSRSQGCWECRAFALRRADTGIPLILQSLQKWEQSQLRKLT